MLETIISAIVAYVVTAHAHLAATATVEPEPVVEELVELGYTDEWYDEETGDWYEEDYYDGCFEYSYDYWEPDYSWESYNYSYYEPPASTYGAGEYDGNFRSDGVVYGDDGVRYTWYPQSVLPGGGLTELNNNGRHLNDDGFIVDGDGYLAVASGLGEPIGTIVETPFGTGKVYDACETGGTRDMYMY